MDTAESKYERAAPYLNRATLRHMKPFVDGTSFRLDPQANVLIGPNGPGKSTALSVFAGQE